MEIIEHHTLLKFISAFVFVIALMFSLAWFVKKMGMGTGGGQGADGTKRLELVTHMALDHKRRLFLIRRDGVEHLLLLGPNRETVVETGIPIGRDVKIDPPDNAQGKNGENADAA